MAITTLNMTAVSQEVFPALVDTIGPILSSTIRVVTDPAAKQVDVNIFGETTGSEFTQATGSYTTSATSTTSISVVTTEIYHIVKMNKLSWIQTPLKLKDPLFGVIGRAIGNKMFAMQNALVTAAGFTNTAITSTAANWDADDMADAATGLSVAKASQAGRYCVFEPTYYGALSKDNAIQQAYAFGDDGVIKRNVIQNVHGFAVNQVTNVAASGDVAALEGWFAAPEAFAVAFRPSFESSEVPGYAQVGSYTEPTTGITITTKIWDGMDGNFYIGGFVGFGISRGQVGALTLLKSA